MCLVTGANSGIGKEVARELARLGASVVMACRDAERGEAARREIVSVTGNPSVELMLVDLSSQRSTRDFARAFLETHARLHVLVNNAGIWSQRKRESIEGVELTWSTNVLAYFLLSRLLRDALVDSQPSRIVNVASELARDLDLSDVEFKRRPYSGVTAYAQSKQADRMLTWALARRLEGTKVTANAVHPGAVATPLFAKAGGFAGLASASWAKLFAKNPREGANTVAWLAASSEVEGVSGRFWADRSERRCRFKDPEAEEALWRLCESMTGTADASMTHIPLAPRPPRGA